MRKDIRKAIKKAKKYEDLSSLKTIRPAVPSEKDIENTILGKQRKYLHNIDIEMTDEDFLAPLINEYQNNWTAKVNLTEKESVFNANLMKENAEELKDIEIAECESEIINLNKEKTEIEKTFEDANRKFEEAHGYKNVKLPFLRRNRAIIFAIGAMLLDYVCNFSVYDGIFYDSVLIIFSLVFLTTLIMNYGMTVLAEVIWNIKNGRGGYRTWHALAMGGTIALVWVIMSALRYMYASNLADPYAEETVGMLMMKATALNIAPLASSILVFTLGFEDSDPLIKDIESLKRMQAKIGKSIIALQKRVEHLNSCHYDPVQLVYADIEDAKAEIRSNVSLAKALSAMDIRVRKARAEGGGLSREEFNENEGE